MINYFISYEIKIRNKKGYKRYSEQRIINFESYFNIKYIMDDLLKRFKYKKISIKNLEILNIRIKKYQLKI